MARAGAVNAALLVMVGGAAGAAGRWQLSRALDGQIWATLIANIAGGLLMGLLAGWLLKSPSEPLRLLLGVGLLGGFTTFSAFSLEAWQLIERGQLGGALGYALASVVGSVLALGGGLAITRSLA